MIRHTSFIRAAVSSLLLACTAPLFAQNEQPTAADWLRTTRGEWAKVDSWLQRPMLQATQSTVPEQGTAQQAAAAAERRRLKIEEARQHYRKWMALLQSEAMLAQWNKANEVDPQVLADLETNLTRYVDHLENDPRYVQFVLSFREWRKAATRESIQKIAADLRQQAATPPANVNRNPSIYRQRIGAAQTEVQDRLRAFTSQGAADWRRFLRWDTLRELSQGDDTLPVATLQELQVILRNGVVVWDVPAMRQLQAAINEAANQAAIAEVEDFPAARKEKLEELAGLVETFATAPTNENRLAMGPALLWLRSHGELRNVVSLLPHVSIPNFRYETTAGVIERDINQHLDESFDVNDYYNGASVRGRARLAANLKATLLPSSKNALWELRMDGTMRSNANASGQGVELSTTGNTVLSATKKIAMDASGMRSQPAVASADASITYSNVDASSWGSYQGQALSRVEGSRGSSEFQAEQRTENYITERLNRDGSKYVRDYNQKYQDNFVYPRARQLAWPHQFQMSTTREILVMDMLDGPLDSLGASTPPPPSPFEADAYVKSHITAFDAYGWRKLAGKKLTVTELKQIMHDLGMQDDSAPPAETPKSENNPPAAEQAPEDAAVAALRAGRTLSFPKQKPIEFTIASGLLTGISHLEGFSSEGKDYDAMTVKFTYRLSHSPTGLEIKRESLEAWPADFVPGSGRRLSGPQIVVRKLLVNVLSDALPTKSTVTHVSGGLGDELPITQFANLGEWICLGMSIPPPVDKPVASVTPKD